MIYCYPTSPSPDGELIRPTIWRSPTRENTLGPQWNCTHSFNFFWKPTGIVLRGSTLESQKENTCHRETLSAKASAADVLTLVKTLVSQVAQVQQDLQSLSGRVDKLALEAR